MDPKRLTHQDMEWVPCALCGSHLAAPHTGIQRLVRCLDCGLIYVNPRPAPTEILSQYNDRYFHCDRPVSGGYEDYLEDENEIRRTFDGRMRKLDRLFPGRSPGNLLDVGCAAGFFLETAREHGWQGQGIEVCSSQAAAARKRGFPVQERPLADVEFPAGSFDMVTLWDVVEHLPDPVAGAASVHKWLKPGGMLVLSTPDAGSWMAHLLRSNWLGFRSVDEHIYFFTRRTLGRLLESAGFAVETCFHVGKHLSLHRIVTRLRYYTRIGAALLRFPERAFPRAALYVNPYDTILMAARKK